jgi:hypothetical protein
VPFPELQNIIQVLEFAKDRQWIRRNLDAYGFSFVLIAMLNGRAVLEFAEAGGGITRLNDAMVQSVLNSLFDDEGAPEGAPAP